MSTSVVVFGPLLVFCTGLALAFAINQYHTNKELNNKL